MAANQEKKKKIPSSSYTVFLFSFVFLKENNLKNYNFKFKMTMKAGGRINFRGDIYKAESTVTSTSQCSP